MPSKIGQEAARLGVKAYYGQAFEYFLSETDFAGRACLEIGGSSLPHEFVRDVLGCERWVSVDMIRHSAGAYQVRNNAEHYRSIPILPIADPPAEKLHERYVLLDGDMADLPPLLYREFDIVIAVNALEHVLRLGAVAAKAFAALRPGGMFLAQHGPVWSGPMGTHFWVSEALSFNNPGPMPPWGHLVMRPLELLQHLLANGVSFDHAEKAVLQAYFLPQINRLFYDEYAPFFEMAGFVDTATQPLWQREPPPDVAAKLRAMYPFNTNFSAYGMRISARKPPAASSPLR